MSQEASPSVANLEKKYSTTMMKIQLDSVTEWS